MNRNLSIFFFLACLFSLTCCFGQTFVMVDVSKSIKSVDMVNAKQALSEILSGTRLSNSALTFGNAQELASYKIKTGGQIYIIRFGNKSTTLAPYPAPYSIQNLPADIIQDLDSGFPVIPTDQQTYLELAVAKVAQFAKQHHIDRYDEVLITDNITDDFGPNGRPDYDNNERDLVQSIGTATNHLVIDSINIVKLNNTVNKDFILKFQRVDVSNLPNINNNGHQPPPPPPPPPDSTRHIIRLISFSGGRINQEIEVADQNVGISWNCSNHPPGGRYNVAISGYDGSTYHVMLKDLTSTSVTQQMDGGKYRITVSASNFSADSATTYIEVSSGSMGWLVLVVLLALLVAGAWFWLNEKRKKKLKEDQSDSSETIFTKAKKSGENDPGNSNRYF